MLHENYHSFIQQLTIERTKVGSIIASVLIPLTAILDYFSSVPNLSSFLLVRFSCAVITLSIFLFLYTKTGKKFAKPLGIILYLVVGLTIAILIRFMGGYETPYYAGLNLVFLGGAVLMPWTLSESSSVFLSIYSFYIIPILILDQIRDLSTFLINNLFLIETLLIALASCYFSSKMRFREFRGRFELEQARDKLKELDEAKNQFFSKVSHELRTPLANIMLPIQNILIERGTLLDPENKREKEAMLRNARRLLKRINEILDISKLEAGKMKVSANLGNINSMLHDILAASSIGAREMGIHIISMLDTQLPKIYADTNKLEKVFSNLISNALKFTERGGTVSIETKDKENHIEISVSDTGIGISEDELPYIFDRFKQVDGSSSRKYEGTGLGLTLVKELVELHHGSVDVTSEKGKGTTFTINLLKGKDHFKKEEIIKELMFETADGFQERRTGDRRRTDRRVDDRRQMSEVDRDTIDSLQVQLSELEQGFDYLEMTVKEDVQKEGGKKSILIVEDNKDLASNIARSLVNIYKVFIAYNGRQALEKLAKTTPDLIVSDVMMPEMDGFELCSKIKSDEQKKHIPVILLTAKATTEDKIQGLKHGADQYLSKPFNPNELRAVVDSLLVKNELEAQLNRSNLELRKTLKELEEAQVKLVHAARLESTGQLAAGIAHEIKNNIYCVRAGLGGIDKRLTLLLEGKLDIKSTYESLRNAIKINNQAIDSSLFIVNSLLDFSGKEKEGMAFCDINKGIENTLTIINPKIKDKVKIQKVYGSLPKVECRIEEINQVIMNIVLNAYESIEKIGAIRIETIQDVDRVRIHITDDGPGIPAENLDKIFVPFFSTKESNANTGLGLSICYNIIKNHQGDIDVYSTIGQGTEFVISLPTRQPKDKS